MKWFTRTVSIQDLDSALNDVQKSLVTKDHGLVEFVKEKPDGKFLIVWRQNVEVPKYIRNNEDDQVKMMDL